MTAKQEQPADRDGKLAETLSEPITSRAILEEVLRQTLARDGDDDACEQEMAALQQVARDYRGLPLELDPVAGMLVMAVLKSRFSALKVPEAGWQTIARHVAKVLLEDPVSHERLSRMWGRLCEVQA